MAPRSHASPRTPSTVGTPVLSGISMGMPGRSRTTQASAWTTRATSSFPAHSRPSVWLARLDQNLDGRLGRAALAHELDGPVQVGFAPCELLSEGQGIAGFHEHVQP